ncbi:MAG: chalcone isomerase family protein [Rubrivivax sp.]|nr:chalcone isomerase family protein [Rubrivivax sp.]MDP3610255.1 chalcone isomerase family protein [Rubrivivax sp.]
MILRRQLLLSLLPLAAVAHAQAPAVPAEVVAELPGARLQGQGRLRFLGLRIYDARLWVGAAAVDVQGADWAPLPLALELQYTRSLDGVKIAERSLKEMNRQGDIDDAKGSRWLSAMTRVFPDVKEGDRITGINVPGMGARFFVNGQLKGDVRDPEFARFFFGIWLSDKTSEPSLRDTLLGKGS